MYSVSFLGNLINFGYFPFLILNRFVNNIFIWVLKNMSKLAVNIICPERTLRSTWWLKVNMIRVTELAVLYAFLSPMRIYNITSSNHTTNRLRSYQNNTMKRDIWWLMYILFINFVIFIVNINEYQTIVYWLCIIPEWVNCRSCRITFNENYNLSFLVMPFFIGLWQWFFFNIF